MARELSSRANSVSIVTVRLVGKSQEYLLLRRSADYLKGEWCQVAGGVEDGETAWEAGLRELREEAGLEPLRFYSADRFEQFYRADWDALVLVPLFVAFVCPSATVRLNHEHSEFHWCAREEAMSLLRFPNQRANIQHVHDEYILRIPNEQLRLPPGGG